MEFMNRGMQQQPASQSPSTMGGNMPKRSDRDSGAGPKGLRVFYVALFFSLAVLLIALTVSMFFGDNGSSRGGESRLVNKDKMQAVFLNGGQVYFGRIGTLNEKYMSVSDIYYLRVNQQVQPDQTTTANDISLVKLGCELHGPEDHMVINREQVIFWENLKDDGQVAKAVDEFKKANPDGQKCAEPAEPAANNAQ